MKTRVAFILLVLALCGVSLGWFLDHFKTTEQRIQIESDFGASQHRESDLITLNNQILATSIKEADEVMTLKAENQKWRNASANLLFKMADMIEANTNLKADALEAQGNANILRMQNADLTSENQNQKILQTILAIPPPVPIVVNPLPSIFNAPPSTITSETIIHLDGSMSEVFLDSH